MPDRVVLSLDCDEDDATDSVICSTLQQLIDESIEATKAAEVIISAIVLEDNNWLAAHDIQPESLKSTTLRVNAEKGPSGERWLAHLLENYMAEIGMQVPFDHTGQDRMVQMLREIQNKTAEPTVLLLRQGELLRKELWDDSRQTQVRHWLWEMTYANFNPAAIVQNPERAVQWSNYSAFLARLFAADVVDVVQSCALDSFGAFAEHEPPFKPKSRSTIEPCTSAATMWILFAAEPLYKSCFSGPAQRSDQTRWTRHSWDLWKSKFKAVTTEATFSTASRADAQAAIDKMIVCEAKSGL